MTFEEYRLQKMMKGEHAPQYDPWDPVRTPHKCERPELVKYEGRVYQVVEKRGDKLKILPLQGKGSPKVVSATSTRLKK